MNKYKHISIVLNGDEISSVLSNKKTTHRIKVRMRVDYSTLTGFRFEDKRGKWFSTGIGSDDNSTKQNFVRSKSPFAVGDLLWVRETFCVGRYDEIDAEHPLDRNLYIEQCSDDNQVIYKHHANSIGAELDGVKWRPALHMRKLDSRITLKIKSVSIERLNDITDKQAVKEGMPTIEEAISLAISDGLGFYQRPKAWFKGEWERSRGGWYENPYVWVVEFDAFNANVLTF